MSNPLNILIIEDSYSYAIELEMIINNLGHHFIGSADNAGDALIEILSKNPDLILMDIEIVGDLSGIDIAEKVSHLGIPVIFLTTYANDEYFEKAAKIPNSTYIIKPADQYTLKGAINLLMMYTSSPITYNYSDELQLRDGAVYLKKKNDFQRVNVHDILYVESSKVYCKTYISDGQEFLNRITLSNYASIINSPNFIRPHRSFLVNTKNITKVNISENVIMIGEHNIPISRKSKNELKEYFKLIY